MTLDLCYLVADYTSLNGSCPLRLLVKARQVQAKLRGIIILSLLRPLVKRLKGKANYVVNSVKERGKNVTKNLGH